MENQEMNTVTEEQVEEKQVELISIKFSRKLARPFTSKNGKDMVAISIPNEDSNDKRAWEEFVLPVQMVHSDHFGSKTLWAKLPEDGTTTLTRSVKPSDEGGEWTREERTVDNKTLKSMVEAYKLKPKTQCAR
ncbi:MAG: hypothetical protein IKW88_10775 [Clostridiales bacterium]|nr:hypothetical protein [Clostridiales bacterium]